MPSYVHFLGPFGFDAMRGVPQGTAEHLLVDVRAGMDGEAIWKLGAWGDPFPIETEVLVVSYAYGLNLQQLYKRLIAAPPQQLVIGNVPIGEHLFKVLDVRPRDVRRVIGKRGGDSAVYSGIVAAEWILLARKV